MKTLIRGLALLLALLSLLSLTACGGGNDTTTPKPTTPALTTPGDDPIMPGDTTPGGDPMMPGDTTPGDDPLLPDPGTMPGTDTTPTDTTVSPNPGDVVLDNAEALLEQGIRMFRELASVRLGKITTEATVDGRTNTSVTSFRFARKGADFMAHTDSGSDTSEILAVDHVAYVRIGDILREKTSFTEEQYNTVLYSATLSVLDALDIDSFTRIEGTRQADGTVRIACHGMASDEAEKLEAVLNTASMDMSAAADRLECVFVLDGEGRIISEHCEIGTAVGPTFRAADDAAVELRLWVEATCEYPKEMVIHAPVDAATYVTVDFEELFQK